jgi:hypothetical protein
MTQNNINTGSRILQRLSVSTASIITGNVTTPADDTIPQLSESVSIVTLAITPKSAVSTLLIELTCKTSVHATTTSGTVALFQDSTANALTAMYRRGFGDNILRYVMTSGTISSTTFKAQVGRVGGTACYINSDTVGGGLMGGVMYAWLTIIEIL